jgi:hypothetical protein
MLYGVRQDAGLKRLQSTEGVREGSNSYARFVRDQKQEKQAERKGTKDLLRAARVTEIILCLNDPATTLLTEDRVQ